MFTGDAVLSSVLEHTVKSVILDQVWWQLNCHDLGVTFLLL